MEKKNNMFGFQFTPIPNPTPIFHPPPSTPFPTYPSTLPPMEQSVLKIIAIRTQRLLLAIISTDLMLLIAMGYT